MIKNNTMPTLPGQNTLQEVILDNICQKISDAFSESEKVSKEKYEVKLKLIESATDMSTQEKLDAMDKNYDSWKLEQRKNILTFAVVSFSLLGLAVGSPAVKKTMRKIIVAYAQAF